jgi:adenylate cyclase class 2
MKTEIEVKFINVGIDDIRKRLIAAGAVCEQQMRRMRRVLIEQPEHEAEHSFIRIRDQGDKITLTFKRRAKKSPNRIDDTKEIEVEVGNFEDTVELFREAGWPHKTYQENRRETWTLDGAEVVIDEWPWLAPQIEIEAEDEATVRSVAEKLGFDWDDAFYGHIDDVYKTEYEFAAGFRGIIMLSEVRFDDPLPKQMTPK